MINIFQPSLGEKELSAVREVFESNWVGRGKKVEAFESAFAAYQKTNSKQMISTTCASEGLFSIMEMLNLSHGDEVIIPTIAFVAKASAVCSVGAKPVFCDVDPHTLNVSVQHILEKITDKTRAIIINHYGGYPAEVDKISKLCREKKIILIEDAACAIGSSVAGKKVGTFGDFAVWSFDSMKVLVTADGGMIYCQDESIGKKLREHLYFGFIEGKKSGFEKSRDSKDCWWDYEISSFGSRAIMNDVTANIGLVQLDRLPDFLARREKIARFYTESLNSISGITVEPAPREGDVMTHYLYWIQLEKRDELARYLLNRDIYTTFRYWPLHWVTKFNHNKDKRLPNAEIAATTTLNIPCHHALTDVEVEQVVSAIKDFAKSNL